MNYDEYNGKLPYSNLKGKDSISCILFMDSLGDKPPKKVLKKLKEIMFAFHFLRIQERSPEKKSQQNIISMSFGKTWIVIKLKVNITLLSVCVFYHEY